MADLAWAYWDWSWNPLGGCLPVDPTCQNCYAAQCAGTKTHPFPGYAGIHEGVTVVKNKRRVFNGNATRPPDSRHSLWPKPLHYKGAKEPKLGPGKRSIIFVEDMSDLFFEKHSDADIKRVIETVVLSGHIGLLLTKRPARMAAFLLKQSPLTVRQWQPNLLLGFSAGTQEYFNQRLPDMLQLAARGWFIFVSIAPMYEPVILPPEFLALGKRTWVIVGGEQAPKARCHPMDPDWALANLAQCKAAGIPFFFRGMHGSAYTPMKLQIRQFPAVE
jgi:protein gp37